VAAGFQPADLPVKMRPAALAGRMLADGDEVEFIAHDIPEPPVSFDVRIVFQDYDIMVADKTANLPCHPAGRYFNHTLWAYLKTRHCLEPKRSS
jgi:23S rRNA-/tRNA-specific pseudouridylate synthase